MQWLLSTFLRGLSVVVPVALTAWAVIWLARTAETLLKPVFLLVLPDSLYVPGMGTALAIAAIFGVGVLMRVFFVKKLWQALESVFERIPLIKSLYNAIQDFMSLFSSDASEQASRVVAFTARDGSRLLGLAMSEVSIEGLDDGLVAVYLPMSYQVGGFTVLVSADDLEEVDMAVEEAMRFIVTAGVRRQSRS